MGGPGGPSVPGWVSTAASWQTWCPPHVVPEPAAASKGNAVCPSRCAAAQPLALCTQPWSGGRGARAPSGK